MTVITSLPPPIIASFSGILLGRKMPKIGQHRENLWEVYQYLKKLEKRAQKNPKRLERFKTYEKEFLKLYEQITAQEKKLEGKTEHITQGFGYSFPFTDRKGQEVFGRLMQRKKLVTTTNDKRQDCNI